MSDKKIDRADLPRPEKTSERHKSQEEFDNKGKDTSKEKQKTRPARVNYVIKDLPIY